MADYNGFKIKRPHSLTPLTSVHEAEAVDGRPGRFALKVFHPPASTNVRRLYAIEGWLLAAERQQQAAKKDGTVVEVLAFGRCEEGAFMVLPWQEIFLEPWIKTLGPKGNTLRALAECLLNTIEAWEKETGGPHGNLKASNVFLKRTGSLVGMTAKLSDPAFLPGTKPEALRLADLNAVGTMLATIVRRRPPGAWPIEDAPEWKGLGNAGKGWLDFCNYLLNPQPNEGEVTLAAARLRLKKVPKDANPVKMAVLSMAAVLVFSAVGVLGFARFGNYNSMPEQFQRLAQTVKNPSVPKTVPDAWKQLCVAWDTWLVDMQGNGPRLLRTAGLLEQNDQLRAALAEFVKDAKDLRPEALVPQAESEKQRLGALGSAPPEAVFNELLLTTVVEKVTAANKVISNLNAQLEGWARWDQLRTLQKLMADRGYTQVAGALATRLPPARGSAEYGKQNTVRTLKFFNDLSLDDTGTLPLVGRWGEITHLSADMDTSGDRVQKAMPAIILGRLQDKSSLSDFADSLMPPLEEMRNRRKLFLDPQVVRDRFLKEAPLQLATETVVVEDFPRWEQELVDFTLVPKTEQADPRLASSLDTERTKMTPDAVDLEAEAPAAEPNGLPTLSAGDFKSEFDGLATNLQTLRAKPIVNRDLPDIRTEVGKVAAAIELLAKRLAATLVLLKPDTWLAKVAQPYGHFEETKQRWAAWHQTAITGPGVTADSLRGPPNRKKFRDLRDAGRTVKEWIDGVEGPTGFGALKMPDLSSTATNDTAAELKRLEGVLREAQVKAVAATFNWTQIKDVPTPVWEKASPAQRDALEKHRLWLGQLAAFASDLDKLSDLLTDGFGLNEGVSEVAASLRGRPGITELAGKPAGWYAEANQLARLEPVSDRGGLLAAAQDGGLSRKLTAWRRFGSLAGWPTGAADFDLDVGVVDAMRQLVGRDIKDGDRRTVLVDEMARETRLRFNRAARVAARAEAQLTEMFNRMQKAKLTEKDLDEPVAFNLALWRMKRADKNEKNLDRLRVRRDTFVNAVRAIGGGSLAAQSEVNRLLTELSSLELKDDPNRVPTPSPATVGWQEELIDEGLGMVATWKSGARTVQLEYSIVQPLDDTPPFYLARRVVSAGEFVALMDGRKEEAKLVQKELPVWAQQDTSAKPWNRPMAWRPRLPDAQGVISGVELNDDKWIYKPDAQVDGLNDRDLRSANPALDQVWAEKPTAKSPLQQVTPKAARVFAEKMLGARLPTTKEWQAVLKATDATATKGYYFRGPNFQKLFEFVRDYHAGGQTWVWRPNTGGFAPNLNDIKNDDGRPSASTDESRLWFRPVDEGPKSGSFINLMGNVSIFLAGADLPTDNYVAGGSVLSPPGIDFTQPYKVGAAGSGPIGGKAGGEPYSDVGLRPAFDAPPGFKVRYKLIVLVRDQKYLTL